MGGGGSQPEPAQPPANPPEQQQKPNQKKNQNQTKNVIINHVIKTKSTSNQANANEQSNSNPNFSLFNEAPKCINNNPSTYACLSKRCSDYPFYCLQCQGQCEEVHHHNKKQSSSISLKQLQKKVGNRKSVSQQLKQSFTSYEGALEDLQSSFDAFYEKQLEMLRQIEIKKDLSPECKNLKRKIQKGEKSGLNGNKMRQLWYEQAGWKDQEEKLIAFLNEKKELLLNMYECFVNINQITQEPLQPNNKKPHPPLQPPAQPNKKEPDIKKETTQRKDEKEKAWHIYKRYQIDRKNLQISKQGVWSSKKVK